MKGFKLYLFLALAAFVLYMTALYNRPKAIDWSEKYGNTKKIPFGAYILYSRLQDIFPGAEILQFREPVYNVLTDHKITKANYIIICHDLNLTEYDYAKLAAFVRKGNSVFIAASSLSGFMQRKLNITMGSEFDLQGAVTTSFVNQDPADTSYALDRNLTTGIFRTFNTKTAIVLGKNNRNHVNYLKMPIGKGALFLNANPLMFTNYSLMQQKGRNYAEIALSYLNVDKTLIWDEYYSQGRNGDSSVMRVFLNNYALRWTFYITLSSLVIFTLFQMKRRQRVIPIIAPLTNASVDFATVVGQVYYEEKDHGNIARKKASYFLEHLRNRYNIKTSVLDEEFTATLARKTGAERTLVHEIVQQIITINNEGYVSLSLLMDFNRNIESFYSQSA